MGAADRQDVVPVVEQRVFDMEQGVGAVGEHDDLFATDVHDFTHVAEEIA